MQTLLSYVRSNKTECIIFGAAFLVRGLYALVIQVTAGSHGFISFSDAEYFYYHAAENILAHHVYSLAWAAPYFPDVYHTPLYPFFIAIFLFFHTPLFGIVLVQDALNALAIVLIYRIAIALTGSRGIALCAALLAMLEPMSIYWSGLLMSDNLFTFLMTASFYFLVERRPYLSMAALGLATLTRPIAVYFFPAYFLMLVYQQWGRAPQARVIMQKTAVAFLIFAAIVLPWSSRNKILFNTWSLSSAGWYLMYILPVTEFAQEQSLALPPAAPPEASITDFSRFDFMYTPVYRSISLSIISHDPVEFGLLYIQRALYSTVSDRYAYLLQTVVPAELPSLSHRIPAKLMGALLAVGELFWVFIYVLDIFAGIERKLWPWWLFFLTLFGINTALLGGVNPSGLDMSRYSLEFYPFFFIFAGVGFGVLRDRWKKHTA